MNFQQNGLEIAIIGISGRFPGSQNVEKFWENLRTGVELISVFPNAEEQTSENSNGSSWSIKAGAVLNDVELFDASFFGFNPREAETIDPQHRLFLECAWEALENAGYNTETEARPIGVYAGVGMGTYLLYNLIPNRELMASRGFLQTLVGVDKDYIPTRVSYKLNLTGPSVSVGTACSSSLVAVHLACQSLLTGECDMAVAAGVSVKVPQNESTLSPDEIVSPDGHCRAFDAKANGTVGGNGIGAVVLKRLEDAIADRDYIYAVIKGSAINNDGGMKVGYTAPSKEGQARVIRAAQVMAEVEPETISYMETHGTGTPLGDPIEIAAMTEAFRVGTDKKGYCAIGSVKTNVGHLDAAAGIAGLIKTTLALHHKVLPPSLNFETPNPQIDFENSPFYVNTERSQWKANGVPRRAGVSSFGFGGTNVHIILEEAPPTEASGSSRPQQLLILSAKTSSALETATANLATYLKQYPFNLADVAYTLQVGRRAFEHRWFVAAPTLENAVQALESGDSQRVFTTTASDRSIIFMFPGQGAQYVNMARELYQSEVTFREECDRCFALLKPHLEIDLRQVLYPTEADAEAAQQLMQTAITQPALFVVEYALAKLWMSWGVRPQAAIGHSVGEYVAACLAGVFSLEDALVIVALRGRLMQQLPAGAMLAVSLSAEAVQSFLGVQLSLAATNAPSLSVVSGPIAAVEQLERQLRDKGIDCRRLHTSHAFHSQMMDSIVKPFIEHLKPVNLNPPQIPFISNVTGTWITAAEATAPAYWAWHLRQSVRFSQGVAELLSDDRAIFLEVGPGRTLSTLTKQQAPERVILNSLRHPQEQHSDIAFLLNTLGRLWLTGVPVDWLGFYAHEKRDRVPLPTYPFERQRYWLEPPQLAGCSQVIDKKPDIVNWFYIPSWKRSLASTRNSKAMPGQTCILVFVDECGLGSQLVERLNQQGQDAIAVQVGSEFSQPSDRAYSLNPKRSHDYRALIDHLLARDLLPNRIVHLWSVTEREHREAASASNLGLERVENAQDLGFYSLLFLTQALGKQNLTDKLQILVVSNNLQEVTGEEILCPEKATLLGPVKVIPQEYPNINCRSIDVVIPATGSWQEKIADQLLTELTTQSSDRVIAYRGNHRWVQTFEPVCLDDTVAETPQWEHPSFSTSPKESPIKGEGLKPGFTPLLPRWEKGAGSQCGAGVPPVVATGVDEGGQVTIQKMRCSPPRLRQRGVYLITGGLGEIGLVLAEYLAETVQAKLILTGRSVFPKKDEWSQWLATHDEDSTSRKIRKLQTLEELGAEVLVISADVASMPAMTDAIARSESQFGQINGVIHAAGILGEKLFCPIEQIGKTECEQQFQPKVRGLLVLEQVLRDKKLDFCVLLSSLSSVLGGLGTVAYAAANLFMDGFTHQHNRENSGFWMSVNWDIWQQENNQQQSAFGSKLFELAITSKEGIEAFQCILCNQTEQVVVSTGNLQARINQSLSLSVLQDRINSQNVDLSLHARPNLQNAYVAPRTEVEQKIVRIWQELLGIKQVGVYDNFFELKGDSLLATRFISRVSEDFQIQVPINTLFAAPTVAGISEYMGTISEIAQKLQPSYAALGSREEGEL